MGILLHSTGLKGEVFLKVNDFSISIGTVNGSGSQSANNILMRSIFKMGVPVGGKNMFPSNIAGLPTWFTIRVSDKAYISREKLNDVVIAMNKATAVEDIKHLKEGGTFIYNSAHKIEDQIPENINSIGIDFNKLAGEVTKSIQLKKLLVNMVYVGVLSELMNIEEDKLFSTVEYQFKGKQSVFKVNQDAIRAGRDYAKAELSNVKWSYLLEKRDMTKDKILVDGNTAGALGFVYGGCTFSSWYPITPSSSLAEGFESFCRKLRVKDGVQNYAMIQTEDELSVITMVAGAGWAGSRAMTTTSGPGVSLMSECIGLMYFAEIPGVIWDVQRMGPSTGLPTRTSQGDILSAAHCSHGDTKHPILLPNGPKECFEFGTVSLDLSERIQAPVFVLSDLDVGMNVWMSDRFDYPEKPMDRGKVLGKEELDKLGEFARYKDVDGDGIPYRTLPGTPHDLAAYFTRGTGHDPRAEYSEKSDNYQALLNRLDKKWETVKDLVPAPVVEQKDDSDIAIIYYGGTELVMGELNDWLENESKKVSRLRLKAFPFNKDVKEFIENNENIVVIEQNQTGQMTELLRNEYPQLSPKIKSLCFCDGMPLCFEEVSHRLEEGGYLGS